MSHSYIAEKVCGTHNASDLIELREIIEITSLSFFEKIMNRFISTPETMIVFENDTNYQKVNLTLEGNNVTTNSWVECAFYSQNGWLPSGFVFNDDFYKIYLESINGYYINNAYITYIISSLLILYLYRKNVIKLIRRQSL